MFNLNCKPL